MKTVAALLGVFSLVAGAEWDALKITYAKNGKGYFDMPWSVEEATAEGKWLKIDREHSLNVEVYSQPEDPRLMLLFDKKGTIAGIRLAFLKDGIDQKAAERGHKFDFQYDNNPMYERGNYFGMDLWYTSVLFVSPKQLIRGGRPKLNKNSDDLGDGVYFRRNKEWVEVSRDECRPNAGYFEANCLDGMGKHYFRISKSVCSRREPVWSLYDEGRLIGFGLAGFGSFTNNTFSKTQNFYEPEPLPFQKIMRGTSSCVENYIENYGIMSIHVFLKRDAAKLKCPQQDWRARNC